MTKMKPRSPATIKRAIRQVRRLIETSPDLVERRIAYEIECALRWASEPGIRGWPPPDRMARDAAALLRQELHLATHAEPR
jgi:hypothetical protein